MATVAAPVWVGFMDEVPVIGTVKEGVEWVLAVYENNNEVLKKKEKQIIEFLQPQMKLLEKGIKKMTLPETPETSQEEKLQTSKASALEFAGLQNIKEIKEDEIIEYVRSCHGGKHGKVEMSKKEIQEKKEKIKKDVEDKIQLLELDAWLAQELMTEVRRSKRGEHVFNIGILKFHSKVLRQFREYGMLSNPWYENVPLADLDGHTLSLTVKDEIMYKMVVNFEDSEFYVNANAVLYGRYSEELKKALHNVLGCVFLKKVSEEKREKVKCIIDLMNKHEIYVDHLAREKWFVEERTAMERFRDVKAEVVKMYCDERGYGWCINILNRLRSWFKNTFLTPVYLNNDHV